MLSSLDPTPRGCQWASPRRSRLFNSGGKLSIKEIKRLINSDTQESHTAKIEVSALGSQSSGH